MVGHTELSPIGSETSAGNPGSSQQPNGPIDPFVGCPKAKKFNDFSRACACVCKGRKRVPSRVHDVCCNIHVVMVEPRLRSGAVRQHRRNSELYPSCLPSKAKIDIVAQMLSVSDMPASLGHSAAERRLLGLCD